MSDADTDPELTALLADLTRVLQELQREIQSGRSRRRLTSQDLSRFTSEVAIPGLILVLETNIRALQLLQRTIQLSGGRDSSAARPTGSTVSDARARAEQLGQSTLSQLDSSLQELQSALDGRPNDDESRELLSQARQLRDEIEAQLESGDNRQRTDDVDRDSMDTDMVDIDVEAELQSLKDDDDGDDSDSEGNDSKDGTDP